MHPRIRGFLAGSFACAAALALFACVTSPISGKRSLDLVPESMENSLGSQSYASMLSQERISGDPKLNALVTRVGTRIANVADKPDYKWEFKVIDSNVQNAFCLPGGKIAVYRGILPSTKNEAGLATVLGHEVTHAIARHTGQRITLQLGMLGGLAALQATALKDNANAPYIMAALGLGSMIGISLPFSRSQESEADETGQILMARAGYDPSESVRFWGRFAEATRGKEPPALLSDHPATPAREEDMRSRLPNALDEYSKAPEKVGLGESY